jgi:hypothetical protein
MDIFGKRGDFAAFIKILEEGRQRTGMRILAYCLMSNNWLLLLWTRRAEDLSRANPLRAKMVEKAEAWA